MDFCDALEEFPQHEREWLTTDRRKLVSDMLVTFMEHHQRTKEHGCQIDFEAKVSKIISVPVALVTLCSLRKETLKMLCSLESESVKKDRLSELVEEGCNKWHTVKRLKNEKNALIELEEYAAKCGAEEHFLKREDQRKNLLIRCREEIHKGEQVLNVLLGEIVGEVRVQELPFELQSLKDETLHAGKVYKEKLDALSEIESVAISTGEDHGLIMSREKLVEATVELKKAIHKELEENEFRILDLRNRLDDVVFEIEKVKNLRKMYVQKVLSWMDGTKDLICKLEVTLEFGGRKQNVMQDLKICHEALLDAKKRQMAAANLGYLKMQGAKCSECDEQDESLRCFDCGDLFCNACFQQLHAKGNRAKHMKVSLEEGALERIEQEVEAKRGEYKVLLEQAMQIKHAGYPEIECRGLWKESNQGMKKDGVRLITAAELEEGDGMKIEVGRGGQSIVYEVDQIGGGGRVAVKRYEGTMVSGKKLKEEAECMWKLRHKNIVEVLGVCIEPSHEALVMELAEKGSLKQEIYELQRGPLERRRIEEVLEQVLSGVGFMHRQTYVHLDLKSSNVLCFGGGVVKVADFGTAREQHETATYVTRAVEMTVRWSAPERVEGGVVRLGPGADMWSVGMVLVEMVSGKVPYWEEETLVGVVRKILEGYPDISGAEYGWCRNMLKQCWKRDAKMRGSAEEVKALMRRVCIVCGIEGEMRKGVVCEGGDERHYLCNMCTEDRMRQLLNENQKIQSLGGVGEVLKENGTMACKGRACVGSVMVTEPCEEWIRECEKVAGRRKEQELKKRIKDYEEERRRGAVARHVNHITENILSLACPRCKQVFYDFNGCFALHCSRAECGCSFCGWCLKDCGTNAHDHVRQCEFKLSSMHFNGTKEEFERAHKMRKARLLREYIDSITDVEVRVQVEACVTRL